MTDFLHPIAAVDPLVWIVNERRTAFSRWSPEVQTVEPGDRVLLYSTQACFRSSRDKGRVFGVATAAGSAYDLDPPIQFADRTYPVGLLLEIHLLAPWRTGVDVSRLASTLATFSQSSYWPFLLRRPLLRLPGGDFETLYSHLLPLASDYPTLQPQYHSHRVRSAGRRRSSV